MKTYMLIFFILLNNIMPISNPNDKYYWIECNDFPYDFMIQVNEQLHIYYLDKRVQGTNTLPIGKKIEHRIQLNMNQIQTDFELDDFPMYNFERKTVQTYFQDILKNLKPSLLLHLHDYVIHDFTLQELKDWYQIYLDKPKIKYHIYPVLLFENQRYLLSEYPDD